MYAAGERNGVLRSTDGGFLWSITNPSSAQFNGISMTANANYVYVVGRRTATTVPDSSFIYRRSNTTGNWELIHIQRGVILRTISSTGDTLLAAGDTTVLVSFNAGQTWIERNTGGQNAGPGFQFCRWLASMAQPDVQLGGCAGRSVALSNDFGQIWTQSSSGLQNTQIVAGALLPNGKTIVSTQFDGLFMIDGVSITRTGAGLPTNDVVTALAADNIVVLAGTANNGLYRSIDGASHFGQALYGPNATGIVNISTKTPGTYFAGGKGEYYHKSIDVAATWTSSRIPNFLTTNITGIQDVSATEYYVATGPFGGVGSGDGVYWTSNSGTSWSQFGLMFTPITSFDRTSDNKFLASSALDVVYEKDNTGFWTATPTLNGVKVRIAGFYQYVNQPHREAVGTSNGLYDRRAFTVDPWTKRSFLGDLEVSWFASRNSSGQVVAGTYGGGVFQSTGPLTSIAGQENVPTEFRLEQNYPNPFNPTTTIFYGLKSREPVTLKVFDVLGREVATLVNAVREPGEHSVMLDATHLASGVYFYRLTAGAFAETRKLVLMR